jgi:glycogen operon protein
LFGNQIDEVGPEGEPIVGDSFLLLLNAGPEPVGFKLVERAREFKWDLVFNSVEAKAEPKDAGVMAAYPLPGRSLVALRIRDAGPYNLKNIRS